ncbi:MAG: terminase family protein [Anaerolineae bacterium]
MKKKIRHLTAHPKQEKIIRSDVRFRVVACGRRFGKTFVGIYSILEAAAVDKKKCWWLAPTYAMADHVWDELKAASRDIVGRRVYESDRRLTFTKRGSITVRSTHIADHLRGAGLDFVVLDEAAFMDSTVWPEVVRPMLLDRQGSALFLSSPNGKNWFWDIYQMGKQRRPHWRSFHFTTADNPLLDPAEIEAIHAQTPERVWREEYLAEFISDSGQVFRGIIEAAIAPANTAPDPSARYVFGLDWGRESDFTAVAVLNATTHQLIALDRFNQVAWSLQRARLRALYDRWQPLAIWAEANSIGSPNIEALQQEGLPLRPFTTTAASKAPLIESLALAIERRDIALLPDETLLAELAAYRMTRLPAGGYSYSAPPGLHDDLVIATALAWYGSNFTSPPISFA